MRTTVTLDPDVERMIRDAMKERSISFKEALNDAARTGLSGAKNVPLTKFVQKSFRLGGTQQFRWDKALSTADAIEDEELSRQLTTLPDFQGLSG
jgi:hypothetical protein